VGQYVPGVPQEQLQPGAPFCAIGIPGCPWGEDLEVRRAATSSSPIQRHLNVATDDLFAMSRLPSRLQHIRCESAELRSTPRYMLATRSRRMPMM
jgi:hypothetical protein